MQTDKSQLVGVAIFAMTGALNWCSEDQALELSEVALKLSINELVSLQRIILKENCYLSMPNNSHLQYYSFYHIISEINS